MAVRLKIGVLLGSTRESRLCDRVAKFVIEAIQKDHEAVIFGEFVFISYLIVIIRLKWSLCLF